MPYLSEGQILSECFEEARMQLKSDRNSFPDSVLVGDTSVYNIVKSAQERLNMVIGCKFPYLPLKHTKGKVINPVTMNADYVVLVFSYLFCQACIEQLDYLVTIRKKSRKKIRIVTLFKEPTEEIEHLLKKYQRYIYIVPEAGETINLYNLGCGFPLIYILDLNKIVRYAKAGTPNNFSTFYSDLERFICNS